MISMLEAGFDFCNFGRSWVPQQTRRSVAATKTADTVPFAIDIAACRLTDLTPRRLLPALIYIRIVRHLIHEIYSLAK